MIPLTKVIDVSISKYVDTLMNSASLRIGSRLKYLKNVRWTGVKLGPDIHVDLRMNYDNLMTKYLQN